mmetsp:Transcript_6020/g.13100  ORF Transcript_6020/g.13100 Transcript_6020/m.13100 type:complete len:447 (+) Transcript_6020:98-1438(+)|eukprot:CAMPEP_0178503170 /NCGR_PEP_ID=MMETSP0696-20121128/17900_1 /TAXON_ID=265572 /ORGANISM="Extubocellulus spinifer, Strain CCMP396" /LENGTH=446 /DNA_ID=CAMNT_0020132287 /DNA_START=33 /DNA_END=1373 /DNA_ORIENTATION=-
MPRPTLAAAKKKVEELCKLKLKKEFRVLEEKNRVESVADVRLKNLQPLGDSLPSASRPGDRDDPDDPPATFPDALDIVIQSGLLYHKESGRAGLLLSKEIGGCLGEAHWRSACLSRFGKGMMSKLTSAGLLSEDDANSTETGGGAIIKYERIFRILALSKMDSGSGDIVGLNRREKLACFLAKKMRRSDPFPFLQPIRESLQYSPKDYYLVVQLHLDKNSCNMPPDVSLVVPGEKLTGLYSNGYTGDFPLDEPVVINTVEKSLIPIDVNMILDRETESQIIGAGVKQWHITAHLLRMAGGGSGGGIAGVCIHDTNETVDKIDTFRHDNYWEIESVGKCLPFVDGSRSLFLHCLRHSNLNGKIGINFDVNFIFDERASASGDTSVVDIALKDAFVEPCILAGGGRDKKGKIYLGCFEDKYNYGDDEHPVACNADVPLGHFIEKLRWQ